VDPADRVFYPSEGLRQYLDLGRIRSRQGGDNPTCFRERLFREKAIVAGPGLRLTTAAAITACAALKISRPEFLRVMREEQSFSYLFSSFLLACSRRSVCSLPPSNEAP
jgi:hypothetical protein